MTEPTHIRTLADLPFHVSGRFPKPVLIRRCVGDRFEDRSSREVFDEVRDLSLGLESLGVQAGDRVAILADSRPEWTITDLATLTAGAVTVPVYASLPPQEVPRREMGRRPMLFVIVPERLRRLADEVAPRRRANQIARFGLAGPPDPPESPMRADR